MPNTAMKLDTNSTTGGRLVSTDGRTLPLIGAHLHAEAGAGLVRVRLVQRFRNPYTEALTVEYLLPLPADGCIGDFSFTLNEVRTVGEVVGRREAKERFEEALIDGKAAALIEQDRSSLFSQSLGNIPPGAEIIAEIVVDQTLRWLDEGAWEWRFPTVVGPRYHAGDTPNAVLVDVTGGPIAAKMSLELHVDDALEQDCSSPSHTLLTTAGGNVSFTNANPLDRDVIVRWSVAKPAVGVQVRCVRPANPVHRGDAFALLTLVPPGTSARAMHRDLVFLIDASGSMGGEPIQQAKRVVEHMIATLGPEDRVELIRFASTAERFQTGPVAATRDGKRAISNWLRGLRAGGATEMHHAVLEALRPLRPNSQRQVVLITDGYIGFEDQIVATITSQLPDGARLHTVGVGSAVNRSLTRSAARVGRGTELIIEPGQGVHDDVVHRLLRSTSAPVLTDVIVDGASAQAPAAAADLFAGRPAMVGLRINPGTRQLTLRGNTPSGPYVQTIEIPELALGQGDPAISAFFAREHVEDMEASITGGETGLDPKIEATGLAFRISSRLTSWVAVSEAAVVDGPSRRERMPHLVPHGVSIVGLGLRGQHLPPPPSPGGPAQMRSYGMARAPSPMGIADLGDTDLRVHEEAAAQPKSERAAPKLRAKRAEAQAERVADPVEQSAKAPSDATELSAAPPAPLDREEPMAIEERSFTRRGIWLMTAALLGLALVAGLIWLLWGLG